MNVEMNLINVLKQLGDLTDGLPEQLFLDLAALMAPDPENDRIYSEMNRDRLLNPHNDPQKPPLRDRNEIIWDHRYLFAHEALKARKRTIKQLQNVPGSGRR